MIKSIAVFCGAHKGANSIYTEATIALGKRIAENKLRLIYGGGNVGLMGVIADAVLQSGGEVTGVIPDFLMQKEVGHKGLTDLILVETMHQRKQIMCDLSDAFVTISGGFGSIDEMFEILTWKQLYLHDKPIIILNINHYHDHLVALINHTHNEQFVRDKTKDMIIVCENLDELFSILGL